VADELQRDGERARLWYTRRDDEVRGPFPLSVIQNHILLGRIRESDELSNDGLHWRTLGHYPELVPEVMKNVHTPEDEAALRLARLRADERRGRERRGNEEAVSGDRRRVERRQPESLDAVQHRLLAEEVNAARRRESLARLGALPTLLILLVALLLVGLFFWLSPPAPEQADVNCSAPAAPGVNWSYCHKEAARLAGVDLSGAVLANARLTAADLQGALLVAADLRYANLSATRLDAARLGGADLTGAVLISASLSGTDLRGADLSFANLEGANVAGADLSGARLHKTIWTDGRLCAPGSVGICERAGVQ
jgi:hypothetical protein